MYLKFASPHFLWLLVSIPFFVFSHFVLLRYNQFRALRFANFAALKRVTGKRILTTNYSLLVLRLLIILALILSISKPVLWLERDVSNYDYVIAIDSSASMSAEDFFPSRLAVAKTTAKEFVDKLPPGSRVGVIYFAGQTFVKQTPESSKFLAKSAIDDVNLLRVGGTDIPGAIITGTNLLLNSMNGRAIIILTDGSNTIDTFLIDSMSEASKYASEKNVVVHSIGIGSEAGPLGYLPEYYNISAVFNEDNLQSISAQTRGLYFEPEALNDVQQAFSMILEHDQTAYVDLDLTFGLAALALVLIFIEWGLINTRFRRFP